jgi:multidrug efflux pump subunit AcrA (membrane-fusion protein)
METYAQQIKRQKAEAAREANRVALERRIRLEKERRDLIERQQAVKKERQLREMAAKTKKIQAQAKLEEAKKRLKRVKPQSGIKRILFGKSKKRRSTYTW